MKTTLSPTMQDRYVKALNELERDLHKQEARTTALRDRRDRMAGLFSKALSGLPVTFAELAVGDTFYWFWNQRWRLATKQGEVQVNLDSTRIPFDPEAHIELVAPDNAALPKLNLNRQLFGSVPVGFEVFVEQRSQWLKVPKTFISRAQPMPDGSSVAMAPMTPVYLKEPLAGNP